GAEEAAAAVEAGQVAGRRPDDAPKYGDVPPVPGGPRPATRFPLPDSVDPTSVVPRTGKIRFPQPEPVDTGAGEPTPGRGIQLPHWTEPPTGEVPRILASDAEEPDETSAWSGFANQPRWRDQASDWDDADGDATLFADDDDERMGALDDSRGDMFSFDEPDEDLADEREPVRVIASSPRTIRSGGRRPAEPEADPAPGPVGPTGGRDLPVAVGVGLAIGVAALVLAKMGPGWLMALVGVIVTLAAVEVFDVFRRSGFRPAVPLALVGTVALLLGAYFKGERAIPLILALLVVFTFLWFLSGATRARPTVNLGVTLLGFFWTAFLGSFAALILRYPNREGVAFLIGTIVAVVANDVGALFAGRRFGTSLLAPNISPNKTWEGFVGGALASVTASLLFLGIVPGMAPWTPGSAFVLGIVVSVVGPLGDLCESMVKRDLNLKDMSSLIPGHGGVLDRFDAILFVLPAVYYLVELLDLAGPA
ncbi:MAG: phosphatidate cytidylyltransferase, partial [Acidimicrobiia bacterium]